MKFKVTGKDFAIFSVFCLCLLYFSAVAVLNVFSLLNDGEFYGLNPVEAFTGKYIIGTLLIFFAVIITVLFSVQSSIFERKGGFGLEIGEKEEKGYSRWLKEKEMKKAYKVYKVGVKDDYAANAGIVLVNDGKNMWVDDGEYHTLVIGVTGSGKTSAVVDPLTYSLVKHRESMVFTDPKGEIYRDHAELLKARGYKIIVLNFRDPQKGNAWNPLTLPYKLYKEGNIDKAIELVDDVANNIVKDKDAQDPFWQNSSSDYFAGCTLGLLEDAKEEEVNLNSIGLMTTVGEEKFGPGSNYIKEYFTMKGEQSSAYTFASNTINSPTETKGGILSTFRQKIRIFSSRENLSEMLSYSDFNMRDIGKEPTAVFMIIHDEKTTYHALATIFIKQCYETLISVAQESGGKLPVRTNFILDEFANMPALKDVTTMVTAARSRLIRFTFIIQNFAQLNEVYGEQDAQTIRSNCGNLIYILTTELSALEEISKLCGEVKSKKDEKSESHPLVTVSDLQKMKLNEVIILRNRQNPFKTQLVQAYKVDWGASQFPKAELFTREKKEIQYFDIKEFVKVRKRSKMGMEEKGGSSSGINPMGGGGTPDFSSLISGGLAGAGAASNPFGGASALPGQAPKIPTFEEFMAARNAKPKEEPKKPNLPTFDVDDLVKRIDAKIAELEAQEKAEEEAKKNGTVSDNSSSSTPIVNMVEPASVEPVKAEPVGNVGFNPFNDSITPAKDAEVIEELQPMDITPIEAPIIENKIEDKKTENTTFASIINNATEEPKVDNFASMIKPEEPITVPEAKPSIMINNPIDEVTSIPSLPEEPIINKPLGGIDDPTKRPVVNNVSEIKLPTQTIDALPSSPVFTSQAPTIQSAPVQQNVVIPASAPVQTVQTGTPQVVVHTVSPTPTVVPTQTVQTVVTRPTTNVTVDTQAKVIPQSSNDEQFFDDFFEE